MSDLDDGTSSVRPIDAATDRLIDDVVTRVRSVVGDDEAFVPLHVPEFLGSEWDLVKECLDTGWVSSVGRFVDRFEQDVARLCGTAHGVAVVNGTAALQIAMLVAGVRAGDEVLVPALTFVATANAVSHAGAIPHFVDSSALTLGLDPEALAVHLDRIAVVRDGEAINKETGRRISAVVPMHAFGIPVDMDALVAVADRYGIVVVEDAAESLGSLYKGRPCGSLGRIAALSFNGNKILTTGGGGAIVTDDPELARRAKHLTTTAKVPHPWAFTHDEIAYNYRLPNLNAALGCAQLEQLDRRLEEKRVLTERYRRAFAGSNGVRIQREPPFAVSNNWLVALLIDPAYADARDAFLTRLNAAGLMSRPVWTLMHRLPMYAECPRAPLPVAEDLERRLINLPSSAKLGRRT